MGYIRKKICAKAGCNDYALPNSAYCQAHQKETNRSSTTVNNSYYKTTFWKKARQQFLVSHMWCEECLKANKHTLANTVHHACGFNSWQTFIDQSKWVAVCDSCHSKIHSKITNEELYLQNKDKF